MFVRWAYRNRVRDIRDKRKTVKSLYSGQGTTVGKKFVVKGCLSCCSGGAQIGEFHKETLNPTGSPTASLVFAAGAPQQDTHLRGPVRTLGNLTSDAPVLDCQQLGV